MVFGDAERGFASLTQSRTPVRMPKIGIKRHGHASILAIALAAPTRVSPPSATEQKQHQENNQYGFHFVPHL
jgi:hypothetical protein